MAKRIIDVACGSRMFWFDKNNPDVEFCDNRELSVARSWGEHDYVRHIEIHPDTLCDFTALPFADNTYKLAVFDPPHLNRAGDNAWLTLKYGKLTGDWKEMLHKGFCECLRVLEPGGVLVFKWSEIQIPLSEILPLCPAQPLFGHRGGKKLNTHWICFIK